MRYRIHHTTSLRYDGVVRLARLNLRLKPALWPGQRVENFALKLDPPPPPRSRPGMARGSSTATA